VLTTLISGLGGEVVAQIYKAISKQAHVLL